MKRLVLAATFAAAFCSSAIAQDKIPIAVIGPMTGSNAVFGLQMKQGAEMAVADINAKGGVNGKMLVLSTEDDACDPKQAVAGANKLAGQKVKLVIGHYCSGSSIPSSKVYAEENIIEISPASTNPAMTDNRAGPTIFRVCGRDDQQGLVTGNYIADQFKGKKVAVLHDKSAYGKGLADATKDTLNKAGVKEVLYEGITAGEKDYSAIVSKMKQAGAELVYFGGYYTEAGLIVRQMREQGMTSQMMSGDALLTAEFWQVAGNAGTGTLMTFPPDPRKNPAAAEVAKEFTAKGIDPEGYVLYSYAALQTWAQAAATAKSEDGKAVAPAMQSGSFKTVIGDFKFDSKGDPSLTPYKIYEWKANGQYDQIN